MDNKQIALMRNYPTLREILENKSFLSLDRFEHHGKTSCLEHTLDVAGLTFRIARKLGLDFLSATRGALLHDFYLYDWHTDSPGLHGFKHPRISHQNAERFFKLNRIESNAILRHMWPLTPLPPLFPESFLVCMADKAATLSDYHGEFRALWQRMEQKASRNVKAANVYNRTHETF